MDSCQIFLLSQGFNSSEIATFLSFVHCSQRNLHYLIFPLQKTICILKLSLAKAVRSYSVLLGRMKTNAASLDETKDTAQRRKATEKGFSILHLDPHYDKARIKTIFFGVIPKRF